jgi:peroxiredoxin
MSDYRSLPDDLPLPDDDGAADHLPGLPMPSVALGCSSGGEMDLAALGSRRTILYVYPMTGTPGVALPDGWDEIPGARGCTPESCAFRDHFTQLREAGADAVYGLSTQDLATQRDVVARLALPYPLLADPDVALGRALDLPTFGAGGLVRYRRLTLVVVDGCIEHVFYPIFPPDGHAGEVLAWLSAQSLARG